MGIGISDIIFFPVISPLHSASIVWFVFVRMGLITHLAQVHVERRSELHMDTGEHRQ